MGIAGNDDPGQASTITGLSLDTVINDPSFYSSTTITISLSANAASQRTGTIEVLQESLAVTAIDGKRSQKEGVGTRRTLAAEDVALLKKQLSALMIPAVPEGLCGFDGVTYTLTIQQVMNRASYTWWVEPPRGWEGLEEIRLTILEMVGLEDGVG